MLRSGAMGDILISLIRPLWALGAVIRELFSNSEELEQMAMSRLEPVAKILKRCAA